MTNEKPTALKADVTCPCCKQKNTLAPWRSEVFPEVKYFACLEGSTSCGYILTHKEARGVVS
jgi:Zn ribbon nucleic-acid-binding protein